MKTPECHDRFGALFAIGALFFGGFSPPSVTAGERYEYWQCNSQDTSYDVPEDSVADCLAATNIDLQQCTYGAPYLEWISNFSGGNATGVLKHYRRDLIGGPSCFPFHRYSEESYECTNPTHTVYKNVVNGLFEYCSGGTPTTCPAGMAKDAFSGQCQADPKASPRCPSGGNPCNFATGNKSQIETDYTLPSAGGFVFRRYYSSQRAYQHAPVSAPLPPLGPRWRHEFERSIEVIGTVARLRRADGREITFTYNSGTGGWDADPDGVEKLHAGGAAWLLTTADAAVEEYDNDGRLVAITTVDGLQTTLAYTIPTQENGDGNPQTLDRVTSHFGRSVTLQYTPYGRLVSITTPTGAVSYGYDAKGRLETVTYPVEATESAAVRQYKYDDELHYALKTIVDENGNEYANWTYDSEGRVDSSQRGAGAESTMIEYTSDTTVNVTGPMIGGEQTTATYTLDTFHGVRKPVAASDRCPTCAGSQDSERTYDNNGYPDQFTDFNGNVTDHDYNDLGLETCRLEGIPGMGVTPAYRRTMTEWYEDLRAPHFVRNYERDPGAGAPADCASTSGWALVREVENSYTDGRLAEQTITAAQQGRTTTYGYYGDDPQNDPPALIGLLKSIDGPRGYPIEDVTTYTYYTADDTDWRTGDLHKVTRKVSSTVSLVTEFTAYDGNGLPVGIEDPNGVITTLSYHPRGWLRTVTTAGAMTEMIYDGVGQLKKVITPEGDFLEYVYDAAHRLTGISDNLGNSITYSLDSLGNRIGEEIKDPSSTLTRTQSWVYNSLGLLEQHKRADQSVALAYTYDANGNRLTATDGLNHTTTSGYDALNRLVTSTDPLTGVTAYAYDVLDQLGSVTDPRGLSTSYSYNALGNLMAVASRDSGETTYTYEDAGNRVTQTDDRDVMVGYGYDALNRLTTIDYADDTLDVTFTYDHNVEGSVELCTNGIGHLCVVVDGSGSTRYAYDGRGNVTSRTVDIDAVEYTTAFAYDAADRLASITYPSGRLVEYHRDDLGRVERVSMTPSAGGAAQDLVTQIQYAPFGLPTAWSFGNGLAYERAADLGYRVTAITHGTGASPVLDLSYAYDLADNIETVTNLIDSGRSQAFEYDPLSRLLEATASATYQKREYLHDPLGNRLQQITKTADGSQTLETEIYTYPPGPTGNNRLTRVENGVSKDYLYDDAGNRADDGSHGFVYGDHNRLQEITVASVPTVEYRYNAIGERVKKAGSGATTVYHYDLGGRLLGETDGTGAILREYAYLDDLMIAMFEGDDPGPPPPGGGTSTSWLVPVMRILLGMP